MTQGRAGVSPAPGGEADGASAFPVGPTQGAGGTPALRWGIAGSWKASYRFCSCIGTMNRDEAAAGALASWTAAVLCRFCARGPDLKAPEDWRTPKPGGTAAGSWKASIRFCACIGTRNPPLTPPRRGTLAARTIVCSPPGRGRGWVGSWRVLLSLERRVHVALVCRLFRKHERDDAAAGRTTRFRSPGGDHHKLAAVD